MWEVDWDKSRHWKTTTQYWARDMESSVDSAREWHWTFRRVLQKAGVTMPIRGVNWEVDWSKRKGGSVVWARNPDSAMPSARQWHWTHHDVLRQAGVPWVSTRPPLGRRKNAQGYIVLTKSGMTPEQIRLCDDLDLWNKRGRGDLSVPEHRVVAAEYYGDKVVGNLVRHLNDVKDDNRPENLVVGTPKENTMDHVTARNEAAYWRQRFAAASVMLTELDVVVPDEFWIRHDEN